MRGHRHALELPTRFRRMGCGSVEKPPVYGLRRRAAGSYVADMTKPPDRSMSLLTALASAAATAYALAYVAHFEWGLSRIKIREDALALAAVLGIALTTKAVLQRRNNRES
jgi:hypothetical protein